MTDYSPNSFPFTPVNFDIPRGACDSHVHVYEDPSRFPFAAKRAYTPPPATADDLAEFLERIRFERVVVVQPSVYGTDNTVTLDAVRRLGERARGVAVIDENTSANELDEMDENGVRGVRLNLETAGEFDPDASRRIMDAAAEQIHDLGWHIQFYTRTHVISALHRYLSEVPITLVIDHFGGAKAAAGVDQPHFDAVVDLVRTGRAYVKISGAYRMSTEAPTFSDVTPLAQRLVAANPDRVVWGTDWPHAGDKRDDPYTSITPPHVVDNGLLLNELPKWVPDAAVRKKILVDNPARLYGFARV